MPCGKLEEIGPDLPYPHSSDARGAAGLRGVTAPGRGQQPRGGALYTGVFGGLLSSSRQSGLMVAKIREGSGRHASERSGRLAELEEE